MDWDVPSRRVTQAQLDSGNLKLRTEKEQTGVGMEPDTFNRS